MAAVVVDGFSEWEFGCGSSSDRGVGEHDGGPAAVFGRVDFRFRDGGGGEAVAGGEAGD